MWHSDQLKLVIWTKVPNHYQRAFFKALRRHGVELKVRYFQQNMGAHRQNMGWDAAPRLEEYEAWVTTGDQAAAQVRDSADWIHCIPSAYGYPVIRSVVTELCKREVPWVHWSERSRAHRWRLLTLPAKRWYGRLVRRHALGAFAIGEGAIDDFAWWGIPRERTALLPYVSEVGRGEHPQDEACVEFKAGRQAFLYMGGLTHRKGTDLLIKAFARLCRSTNEWVLLLVGPQVAEYEKLARDEGIDDRVLFRGAVSPAELGSALAAGDVLVLPSRRDGWGVVLNEGANAGCALIATSTCGATKHLIEAGWNGFQIRPNSVDSLADAMNFYVRSPGLVKLHGERSRNLAERFTPDVNAQRCIDTLAAWRGTTQVPAVDTSSLIVQS